MRLNMRLTPDQSCFRTIHLEHHRPIAISLSGFAIGVAVLLVATVVLAHGGGLNSEGCHNNRKTGDYHCHRGPAAADRPTPRKTGEGAPVKGLIGQDGACPPGKELLLKPLPNGLLQPVCK